MHFVVSTTLCEKLRYHHRVDTHGVAEGELGELNGWDKARRR